MILTIYLTGLVVCIIYDMSAKIEGTINPQEGLSPIGIFLDWILWPLTLSSALAIAIFFREIRMKDEWLNNWSDES